jgi:hypothetical protein
MHSSTHPSTDSNSHPDTLYPAPTYPPTRAHTHTHTHTHTHFTPPDDHRCHKRRPNCVNLFLAVIHMTTKKKKLAVGRGLPCRQRRHLPLREHKQSPDVLRAEEKGGRGFLRDKTPCKAPTVRRRAHDPSPRSGGRDCRLRRAAGCDRRGLERNWAVGQTLSRVSRAESNVRCRAQP